MIEVTLATVGGDAWLIKASAVVSIRLEFVFERPNALDL